MRDFSQTEIVAETSTTGIATLMNDTAQIGMENRQLKPTEMSVASAKRIILRSAIVALDALSIILNQANDLTGLTKKQLEDIFTGDITNWNAVGGNPVKISVYTRNTSSGTYSDWKELAMKKLDRAGSSQKMVGNEQIAGEVGKKSPWNLQSRICQHSITTLLPRKGDCKWSEHQIKWRDLTKNSHNRHLNVA